MSDVAELVIRRTVCDVGQTECVDEQGEYLPTAQYRVAGPQSPKGRKFVLCANHAGPVDELLALPDGRRRRTSLPPEVVSLADIEAQKKPGARRRTARR